MNKKCLILFLLLVLVFIAAPAYAQYSPLVRLPGLPPAGPITLSEYLVGLYNFLVSIVGIVAVMMMIVGGLRYITAAGSSTAISDAKDIVTSAVWGLVLAIFAWIIVAAINPDVLYIRQPGSGFSKLNYLACATQYNATTCTCNDAFAAGAFATADACDKACRTGNHCVTNSSFCVRDGVNDTNSPRFQLSPNNGKCLCIGEDLAAKTEFDILPTGPTCQQTCQANNCFVIRPKIGELPLTAAEMVGKYDPQQVRNMAIKDPGSDVKPLTLPTGASFVMDLESSIVFNKPATYSYDNTGPGGYPDGICDTPFAGWNGLGGNWAVFTMYETPTPWPANYPCKLIVTPDGEQCVAKICGTDSLGHKAEYYFPSITLYN